MPGWHQGYADVDAAFLFCLIQGVLQQVINDAVQYIGVDISPGQVVRRFKSYVVVGFELFEVFPLGADFFLILLFYAWQFQFG